MDHFTAPRGIILLVLSLILVVFLAGTLLAFAPAPAPGVPASSEQQDQPHDGLVQNNSVPTITLIPTFTPSTSNASLITPTPVPSPARLSHREPPVDMTGVISLGILVVVITLIGTIWGEITDHHKKAPKK